MMRRLAAYFAVMLGVVLIPAAIQAEEPLTLGQLRDRERQRVERELGELPFLGQRTLGQILTVKVEDRQLIVQTSLPPGNGPTRVQITDMPGLAWVKVTLLQGYQGVGDPPKSVQLMHYDFSAQGAVLVITTVLCSPGYLQIAQDVQFPGEDRSISLIQNRIVADPGDDIDRGTVLYVKSVNHDTGQTTIDHRLNAGDILALVRLHPEQSTTFLRPILGKLGAESAVFSVEESLAWQVLGEDWPVDEKLLGQMQQLVEKLKSARVEDRDAAAEALQKKGPRGALLLMRLPRSNLRAEQNARLDELLKPYQALSKQQIEQLREHVDFLIDCLNCDDVILRQLALDRLRRKLGSKIEFDVQAVGQARWAAMQKLRQQIPRKEK